MERHCEESKKVVLTADDFRNVTEFFTHFKIEMPTQLASCIAAYNKDPAAFTFEDQKLFRAYLAMSINVVDHPLVKDDVFKNIRAKCDKAWYDAQFDSDITTLLSGKDISEKVL